MGKMDTQMVRVEGSEKYKKDITRGELTMGSNREETILSRQ